ncbi:hypothetical protein KDL29_15655 [bacterium]|nr:hypothetical protein [bacterium]
MIQHLDNWLAQFRTPFWEAIYLDNHTQCQASLDQAQRALGNSVFSGDELDALRIYVHFMRYQLKHYFAPSAADRADLARGEIVSVSLAQHGPLAGIMQARCSLTQRCWAHAMHNIGIPRGHVDNFYRQVPEEDRDHQLMNYLSFWAFAAADIDYMEQSYRYFLMVPVEFMVDFSRQRVKVMQAILKDDLERVDLLRLFELMPHRMHAAWFEKLVLPVLKDRNLIAESTMTAFEERRKILQSSPPAVPPRTQAKGKISLNF